MSKLAILPGHEYDVVSPQELDAHFRTVNDKFDAMIREAVRGVKPIRFTSGVVTATSSFLRLPITDCPQSGYVWTITRLVVGSSFLTPGVILFRTADPSSIVLTANNTPNNESLSKVVGNIPTASNTAITFSKGQLSLQAGEYLVAGIFDAALATHPFVLSGEAIEVPAEMIGKLLV